MEKQSVHNARVLDIADTIIKLIPEVDKRSPFDPPNLAGVITGTSEDGYYKIGTPSGHLTRGMVVIINSSRLILYLV